MALKFNPLLKLGLDESGAAPTDTSGFVPYTGATGSVTLGSNNLTANNLTATNAVILDSPTTAILSVDRGSNTLNREAAIDFSTAGSTKFRLGMLEGHVGSDAYISLVDSVSNEILTIQDLGSTAKLTVSQADVSKVANLTSDGFVKTSGGDGTLSVDTTAYAPIASPTFTGTVTIPTPFTLGAVSVTATGTELNILDGVTASTSEINVLDGITATVTELNYTDGVTSAIQTQLDAKVDENSAIVAATKTKITYDTKGLVTAGADATTADIADSADRRYVTDAESTVIDNTSGTNTGDQTITLTGDVTGSGTGSFAATIANDAVTYAKLQNISATDRLLGRDTAAAGNAEELTVGGGIEFTGSGGIQTSAFTGDVTKAAGGTATTIANDAVTYAKMQNVSATSRVLGRITSGAGDVEELTAANLATIANSTFDHGTLAGLTDDDHTGYARLVGRSGGQTLIGGTASGDDLTLNSTSNATKGTIFLNDSEVVINETSGDHDFRVESNGETHALFIDAGNDVVAFGTANPTPSNSNSTVPKFVYSKNGTACVTQFIRHTSVGAGGAIITLSGTRGSDANSYTALQSGDGMGTFGFSGADGTRFIIAADVRGQVDGAVSTDVVPGRLVFGTGDGTSVTTPKERLRIDSAGAAIFTTDSFIQLTERTATPGNPTAGASCNVYMKADKFVIQFNEGGTINYFTLDLTQATGGAAAWVATTSAP